MDSAFAPWIRAVADDSTFSDRLLWSAASVWMSLSSPQLFCRYSFLSRDEYFQCPFLAISFNREKERERERERKSCFHYSKRGENLTEYYHLGHQRKCFQRCESKMCVISLFLCLVEIRTWLNFFIGFGLLNRLCLNRSEWPVFTRSATVGHVTQLNMVG